MHLQIRLENFCCLHRRAGEDARGTGGCTRVGSEDQSPCGLCVFLDRRERAVPSIGNLIRAQKQGTCCFGMGVALFRVVVTTWKPKERIPGTFKHKGNLIDNSWKLRTLHCILTLREILPVPESASQAG